jgi:CheY-like chemotaxis protein
VSSGPHCAAGTLKRMATVLLADDDALVRRVITEALEAAGHRVLAASDECEALAVQEAYDVALVDAHLGKRLRSTLGDELRNRRPGIRLIVMSGLPGEGGYLFADAVLAKPFSFEDLLVLVSDR